MRTTFIAAVMLVSVVSGFGTAQTASDLFVPESIRDVQLTMSERDWDTLRENFLANTYYPGDVRIIMDGDEVVARNIGVRSRGSGSRSGVKPALKLDLSRYVSGQRLLGLRAIILRNMTQDPSMVHEHVTLALQRRMGLAVPRTVFARLFVNQRYSGLYEVVEDVDEEFLDRVRGEHSGYLYEFTWTYPYYFQYLGPELEPYAGLWEPKTRTKEPASLLYGPFEALSRAIQDSRADRFAAEVGALIDVRQVLQLTASDNFMADWDGMLGYAGLNNIYLYRPPAGPAMIVPWDKDNAFHDLDQSAFDGTEANRLVSRAMQDPALRAVYVEGLQAAARFSREVITTGPPPRPIAGVSDGPLGWLETMVESSARLIRKSVWADPVKPFSNDDFEAGVAAARRFARLRASVVEAQVAAGELAAASADRARERPPGAVSR